MNAGKNVYAVSVEDRSDPVEVVADYPSVDGGYLAFLVNGEFVAQFAAGKWLRWIFVRSVDSPPLKSNMVDPLTGKVVNP